MAGTATKVTFQEDAGELPLSIFATPAPSARRLSSFHHAKRPPRGNALTPVRLDFGQKISQTPAKLTSSGNFAFSARKQSTTCPFPLPTMSDEALAEMYSTTIKLCQENKINAKNTWSLNLIDYMGMLVKTPAEKTGKDLGILSSDTNFQVAGVTLDAGVRIYCSRVDSVHINAFKVLGALSRTSKPEAADDIVDDNGGEDDEGGLKARKKRNMHRSGGSTLESNLDNITTKKLETDLVVDPLFQKMSAAFDEGGAKGMLLNNLSVGPTYEVMFDSSEPAYTSSICCNPKSGANDVVKVFDVSNAIMDGPHMDSSTLCPRFLAYYNARCSPMEARSEETSSTQIASFSTEYLEMDDSPSFDYDDDDMDTSAILGALAGRPKEPGNGVSGYAAVSDATESGPLEDEDDVNVLHANAYGRSSEESSASIFSTVAGNRLLVSGGVDLIEAGLALQPNSEYMFFDSSVLQNWAGPQHWRFRAASANSTGAHGKVDENKDPNSDQRKRAKGKTAMLLDFTQEAPNIDFAAAFAPPKNISSIQLTDAVRDSFTEKRVTLPEDLHYRTETLATLFLKPKIAVVAKRKRTHESNAGEVELYAATAEGWYDFDNDCENDNDCGNANDTCVTESELDFDFENGQSRDIETTNENTFHTSLQTDMVPEPTRVEKVDIGFATVAKKVDVRQLKNGLWDQLRGRCVSEAVSSAGTEIKVGSDQHAMTTVDIAQNVCAGGTQTLQQVVQNMPSYIPESSLSDVSLSYIFICLLHLANEESLQIAQKNEGVLDDLVITQGKEG